MKRIWFTQQKPFDYVPLRWGLGYIEPPSFERSRFSPKIYTTRTHALKGEYYVVEGSRFKAKPVEPRIEFQVKASFKINLRKAILEFDDGLIGECGMLDGYRLERLVGSFFKNVPKEIYTYPELDLGVGGATFYNLRSELLRLNKNATLDTPFYVNLIEPILN